MSEEEDHCYICLGPETDAEKFIQYDTCKCKGSLKIHWPCFSEIMLKRKKHNCDICKSEFNFNSGVQIEYPAKKECPAKKTKVIVMDITERKIFSKDGILLHEGKLINDKEHGIWKEYYPSGELEVEKTYVNGILHGPAKIYNKSGTLRKETIWINGSKQREILHDA